MQLNKDEIKILIESVFYSSLFMLGVGSLHYSIPDDSPIAIKRILVLLGADFSGGGYIQWVTYVAFVWSLKEIFKLKRTLKAESSYFKAKLLPTDEKHLLMADDVLKIHHEVKEFEKTHAKTLLTSLIKNSCAKFRSTKNISEMLDVINILTELHRDTAEMEQSNIRFLVWAIPSIGFIGTVLGISQSLMIANSNDMQRITATLGVAFDTTLISLILSIVLMWFYHDLQKISELFHVKSKEYVIENLVNRIEM